MFCSPSGSHPPERPHSCIRTGEMPPLLPHASELACSLLCRERSGIRTSCSCQRRRRPPGPCRASSPASLSIGRTEWHIQNRTACRPRTRQGSLPERRTGPHRQMSCSRQGRFLASGREMRSHAREGDGDRIRSDGIPPPCTVRQTLPPSLRHRTDHRPWREGCTRNGAA